MTTPARERLMNRGVQINIAANHKLMSEENIGKGDDWDSYDGATLYDGIQAEVNEVFDLIDVYLEDESGMGEDEFKLALVDEAGDVLNFLRFICSKHGAI